MKIQYIAVIFIIIIVPIVMVTSSYINSQLDTIRLQSNYNSILIDSTYDAIRAFQINTVNNRYSSISDSKIRDIEAAINSFYNALASNENLNKDELQAYVPALVFTLYDGYYIYSKYDNVYAMSSNHGRPQLDENELKKEDYTKRGLRPYIYYSCHYKKGAKDFVVNYTLDNAITLYGNFGNGTGYQTKSGYLIDPSAVNVSVSIANLVEANSNPLSWTLTYSGVEIGPEILTEYLAFIDDTDVAGNYDYLVYNGQKIYYDGTARNYFRYQNYKKAYLSSSTMNGELLKYLEDRTSSGRLYSTSAFEYYYEAQKFSREVADLTQGISQNDAIDEQGNQVDYSDYTQTGSAPIFVANSSNDPLIAGSTFNENRAAVIRMSIETNLAVAIHNYSAERTLVAGSIQAENINYEFALPVLSAEDWDKITNKVSMISFMQGIPIGHKYFNNYCVMTNDNNEEVVSKENIYLITRNMATGEREYHLPGCMRLLETDNNTLNLASENTNSYSNLSFIRQTIRIAEGEYKYFYPQTRKYGNSLANMTACYYCIVSSSNVYSPDEIIKGVITDRGVQEENVRELYNITTSARLREIRSNYLKALGRERYDLYRANVDAFNIN